MEYKMDTGRGSLLNIYKRLLVSGYFHCIAIDRMLSKKVLLSTLLLSKLLLLYVSFSM